MLKKATRLVFAMNRDLVKILKLLSDTLKK